MSVCWILNADWQSAVGFAGRIRLEVLKFKPFNHPTPPPARAVVSLGQEKALANTKLILWFESIFN